MEWTIDRAETVVEFSIKKFWGLVTVKGLMQVQEGRLELNTPADYGLGGSVFVAIDPASIVTGNSRRDVHLKTADFFEVERYPIITFRSRSIEQNLGLESQLKGKLTIRDVTRPVTLEVSPGREGANGSREYKVTTTLLRDDFGLNFKKIPIGNKVMVTIKVKFLSQAHELNQV